MAERLLALGAGYRRENVLILWKGYFNWQEAGYEIEKPHPSFSLPGQVSRDISVAEAFAMIQQSRSDSRFVLLDVRTPEENAEIRLEGSSLIDIKNLAFLNTLKALDKSYRYVVY